MVPSPERIVIEGFKSIRKAEVELRPLNVLIGANGSGKSNFVEVFRLLRRIVASDEGLQKYVGVSGGASVLLHFGRKRTERIVIDVTFGSGRYRVELLPTDQDSLVFGAESCSIQVAEDQEPYVLDLGRGHRESRLHDELAEARVQANRRAFRWERTPELSWDEEAQARRGVCAERVLQATTGWVVHHFHDTSATANVKQTGHIDDNVALRPDGGNLAAFLYLLRRTRFEHYRQVVSTVRLAAPFFEDFVLRPAPDASKSIKLEWLHRGSDAYFDASALSDGTLRFMCLAALLLQPGLADRETTLIIDEPELGLHPYAVTLLAGMLREAAHAATVIVSTQSASLVNQFAPEDVLVVDRVDEQTVFERRSGQDLAHWLEDYGLGDLWEKNVIGGGPR